LANFNLPEWIATMLIFIVAVTVHEFAHALAAVRCGDSLPRTQGRLTLNPVDHLDPIGTLMMAISTATGIGLGWGKPVQYNPSALRHPRWDPLWIAFWGPISNVLQAALFAGLLRLDDRTHWLGSNESAYHLLNLAVYLNLVLALFNMIPIPPLDGSKIFSSLLPLRQAQAYDRVMGPWGMYLFLLLALSGLLGWLIGPPADSLFHVFVG
jgi:Zn-dependent protease